MIFATLGNESREFKRLVNLLLFIARNLSKEEIFFQNGHTEINSKTPANLKFQKFISKEMFKEKLINSRVVITHAGAGTLLQCMESNIVPLVMPRRYELHEHLNNHQLEILNEFSKKNLCINIDKMKKEEILNILNNKPNFTRTNFTPKNLLLKKLKKTIMN